MGKGAPCRLTPRLPLLSLTPTNLLPTTVDAMACDGVRIASPALTKVCVSTGTRPPCPSDTRKRGSTPNGGASLVSKTPLSKLPTIFPVLGLIWRAPADSVVFALDVGEELVGQFFGEFGAFHEEVEVNHGRYLYLGGSCESSGISARRHAPVRPLHFYELSRDSLVKGSGVFFHTPLGLVPIQVSGRWWLLCIFLRAGAGAFAPAPVRG